MSALNWTVSLIVLIGGVNLSAYAGRSPAAADGDCLASALEFQKKAFDRRNSPASRVEAAQTGLMILAGLVTSDESDSDQHTKYLAGLLTSQLYYAQADALRAPPEEEGRIDGTVNRLALDKMILFSKASRAAGRAYLIHCKDAARDFADASYWLAESGLKYLNYHRIADSNEGASTDSALFETKLRIVVAALNAAIANAYMPAQNGVNQAGATKGVRPVRARNLLRRLESKYPEILNKIKDSPIRSHRCEPDQDLAI
jgi:hypothetical protein